jgi:hypothetical protein
MVTRKEWFKTVSAVCYMWDRKSPTELTMTFPGYKCENYYYAQAELMKLGGAVMSERWDPIGGCTHVVVREPKKLEE